jgi:DNA-binding transcriptional ArsR family regulator
LKALKVVTDPKAFELLADETRRRIIYLLRAKELTVSQIAEQLDKTPQAIYHHIRKLLECGLVDVAKEERLGHFIETYYRASAEVFHLSYGECESEEFAEQRTRDTLQALEKLGFTVKIDEKTVSRLVELDRKIEQAGMKREFEEKISELEDVDFLTKQDVAGYMKHLFMTDRQFDDWLDLMKEFRELLRSALAEPIEASTKQHRTK